jgi:hypothetical protein
MNTSVIYSPILDAFTLRTLKAHVTKELHNEPSESSPRGRNIRGQN